MTLLDTGVRYANPEDVERYVRNKDFSASSDPTKEQVRQLCLEVSDAVDKRTRRAWRLRERAGLVRRVEFSHDIEAAHQRRRRRQSRHGFLRPINEWGLVNLDRARVSSVEKLEVLLPESTEDITADQGRDGKWYVDERQGSLYVEASEFIVGPLRGGGLLKPAKVRVTFRYGEDEQGGTDAEALSESVPGAVRRATAKLAAAELLESDQYGAVLPSGADNTPNQGSAAESFRQQAYQNLDEWRIKKVM